MIKLNKQKSLLTKRLSKLKEKAIGDIFIEQECEFIETKLNSGIYNIVVVGQFSAGKSTFINALMGAKLLPSSVKETTAVTTRVFSVKADDDRVDKAAIHFKTGKVDWVDLRVDQHALKKFATLLENELDVEEVVDFVEVYRTIPLLGDGICIVDTPGENGMKERIFEATKKEIKKATAIIYLMPHKGVSGADAQLLKYITQYQERVFFVVNSIDSVPEDEREMTLNSNAKRIEAIGVIPSAPIIYGLSSKEALKGRMENDPELLHKSGLPVLESALFQYIENSEHVISLFNSVDNDLKHLEDDLLEVENQKKEQQLKTEEKRRQIEMRINNLVRRMRLEYDELEQGLLLYIRNETEQIMLAMNHKKAKWVERISPSFEREAIRLSQNLKTNLMGLIKNDWKDMNLFVSSIKEQMTALNNEINHTAYEKFIDFVNLIQADTVELERYIPKRNREVIELIMKANLKKTASTKRFSQLVKAINDRDFQFEINYEGNQLDKRFQSVIQMDENKNALAEKSKAAEKQLENLTDKIDKNQHAIKSAETEIERETRGLGSMPNVETYYYDEEVSRKGLGRVLDLFSTKTVRRKGTDDSKQKKWIKEKETIERNYSSKISTLAENRTRLKIEQNEQVRLKRQHDRKIRELAEQNERQIIEIMEDIQTSYQEYAKKCIKDFHLSLNQHATEVHRKCTDDLNKDRKEINGIIKTHVRQRINQEEAEIRKQHSYLFEEVF